MEPSPAGGESVARRPLLVRGLAMVAGSVVLAGCTDDVGEELPANEHWPSAELGPSLPVRERTEILESGVEAYAEAEFADVDDFVSGLRERHIALESVTEAAGYLHGEYAMTDPERRGTLELVGLVAGAYAPLVAGGFDGRRLELVLLGGDGRTVGGFEVQTRWAVGYNEGALSAAEYGELASSTVESKRTPPDRDVAPEE